VLNKSGKYDLIYNETVIGELGNEKQISFQAEEETVTLAAESLEVKDEVLVTINRERTKEMGVDWVEQMWDISGEKVAVGYKRGEGGSARTTGALTRNI